MIKLGKNPINPFANDLEALTRPNLPLTQILPHLSSCRAPSLTSMQLPRLITMRSTSFTSDGPYPYWADPMSEQYQPNKVVSCQAPGVTCC